MEDLRPRSYCLANLAKVKVCKNQFRLCNEFSVQMLSMGCKVEEELAETVARESVFKNSHLDANFVARITFRK